MPAFLAFLAEDTKVGERTARQYVAHLQRFADWLGQRYQAALLEATTRDVRQYKTELGKRQKPASVNAALAALRRFFQLGSRHRSYRPQLRPAPDRRRRAAARPERLFGCRPPTARP
jgi:site-specific recombinase XerD